MLNIAVSSIAGRQNSMLILSHHHSKEIPYVVRWTTVYRRLHEVSVVEVRIMPSAKYKSKRKRCHYVLDIQFVYIYVWPSNIGQGAVEIA